MSISRKWTFALGLAGVGLSVLSGCSQSVTQDDVNREQRQTAQKQADAEQKTHEIRHEVRKEIADIEQDRTDKVAKLRSDIQTNKDADAPKLQAKIDETNREADKKIAAIREKAGEKQEKLGEAVREQAQEAQDVAHKYQSQEAQKQYVDDRQKELEKYDLSIADLKKTRDNLAGEARERFDLNFKHLDENRDKANKALSDLKGAKPEEWMTFRDEVQRAFAALHTAFQEASGRGA